VKPHRARKRFGQNFLRDDWVINRIISLIDPVPGDHLVEIGPGQAALTRPLLAHNIALDIIELDRDLIPGLTSLACTQAQCHVHEQDALTLDLASIDPAGSLRVVGNLPYNISTPLLFHMLDQIDKIKDMHFMLQKEVVDRMAATPGSRTYGRLSVMTQHRCTVEHLIEIGPECFEPMPKVTSALVRLTPHTSPSPVSTDTLSTVVRQAFSQRRKTLRNSMKKLIDEDGLRACSIDPTQRPEQIDLAGYRRMADFLTNELADHACAPEQDLD